MNDNLKVVIQRAIDNLDMLSVILVITQNYCDRKFSAEVAMQNIIDLLKDKEG
jgi:hypothetical protein